MHQEDKQTCQSKSASPIREQLSPHWSINTHSEDQSETTLFNFTTTTQLEYSASVKLCTHTTDRYRKLTRKTDKDSTCIYFIAEINTKPQHKPGILIQATIKTF